MTTDMHADDMDATDKECAAVTHEEFVEALADILDEMSGEDLLGIPGVYEVVSEAFNNEALQRAVEKKERDEEEEEEDEPDA